MIDEAVRRSFPASEGEGAPAAQAAPAQATPARRGAPTTDEIRTALERHGHRISAAAAELGVSRSQMYALADELGVRTGRNLARGRSRCSRISAATGGAPGPAVLGAPRYWT